MKGGISTCVNRNTGWAGSQMPHPWTLRSTLSFHFPACTAVALTTRTAQGGDGKPKPVDSYLTMICSPRYMDLNVEVFLWTLILHSHWNIFARPFRGSISHGGGWVSSTPYLSSLTDYQLWFPHLHIITSDFCTSGHMAPSQDLGEIFHSAKPGII